jgi:hypothetical protein
MARVSPTVRNKARKTEKKKAVKANVARLAGMRMR